MSKMEKQNAYSKRDFTDTPRAYSDDVEGRRASIKDKLQKKREAAEKILNKREFTRR